MSAGRGRLVGAGRRRAVAATTAAVVAAVALTALAPPLEAKRGRSPSREELTNFLLGPDYSQWLVGAAARIASEQEIREYLALDDDAEAAEFIDAFWQRRRNPDSPWPDDQPRAVFERRAEEADRLFSEGLRLGRRTDRGTLHVLYGRPDEQSYELPQRGPRRPVEVWAYPKDAPPGLDGERPARRYYFVERDGETVLR